jgi:hypothetical protein
MQRSLKINTSVLYEYISQSCLIELELIGSFFWTGLDNVLFAVSNRFTTKELFVGSGKFFKE